MTWLTNGFLTAQDATLNKRTSSLCGIFIFLYFMNMKCSAAKFPRKKKKFWVFSYELNKGNQLPHLLWLAEYRKKSSVNSKQNHPVRIHSQLFSHYACFI